MPKIIQPLSNPDDINREADAAVREKFADYYLDAPAPDPLDFHPAAKEQPDPTQVVVENSLANDPLKDL